MELRYRREATVGVFLVVSLAIFVFLLMWLRGKSFRRGEIVRATFADVAGLKEGDPVRTAGVKVGDVKRVFLEEDGRVSVHFQIRRTDRPKADARALIRALDFFGARYIDYLPGTSSQPLDSLQPMRGLREQELTEVVEGMATPGRDMLANAAEMLSPRTTAELRGVLVEAQRLLQQLGEASQGPSREAAAALVSLRQVFQRMDLLLANAANAQTLANARDITGNLVQITNTLQHTSASLDSIMAKINAGRGTAGQLVNDTTLLADLHRTTNNLNALITDFMANPRKYINVSVF